MSIIISQVSDNSIICSRVCWRWQEKRKDNDKNSLALHYWPFVWRTPLVGWIPTTPPHPQLTKGQQCGKCFHIMMPSCLFAHYIFHRGNTLYDNDVIMLADKLWRGQIELPPNETLSPGQHGRLLRFCIFVPPPIYPYMYLLFVRDGTLWGLVYFRK